MKKKSRNNFNNMSLPSLEMTRKIKKIKLKPINIYNKRSLYTNHSQLEMNNLKKQIPVSLFQNNEVNMVRNLNLDDEKNFCESLLFKETLEKNMMNQEEILGGTENNKGINLPKIKSITITGIIESEKRLNENKKISLRNLANNQLEKELYETLKEVKNKLRELKEKKYGLYKNFDSMSKELKEINLELEAIESVPTGQGESFLSKILNFNSPSRHESGKSIKHISKRLSKTPIKIAKESLFMKSSVQVGRSSPKHEINLWGKKYEDKIKKIKILYLAKRENEEKKMEKFKKAKQIKEDLKQLDTEINEINNQLTDLKSKENNTIQKLMRHYEGLLYRGRDTRNDGLIWIIKSMWKLGKNVPMQFIPTFLDFNAIEFLFKLANKSIELENKKKLLNESKKNLILKVHKSYFYNNNTDNTNLTKNLFKGKNRRSSLLFKTNLIKQNKILQRSVSQTNIVKTYIHSSVDDEQRDQEMTTFKEISKLVEGKKINMEIGKIPGMENIEELQNKIKSIENEIVELKNQEIIRIFKEFIENDYQNKYHVSIDIVLAALLGEHMKNIEINKFSKFKKEYCENLKNIRFYEYRKKNDSK